MGFLSKLFGRASSTTVATTADSIGNLAKDMRTAITGDIPPAQRAELYGKILDITSKVTELQSNVIITEMGGSWLQRNWRPLLMLICIIIIAWNYMFVPVIGHNLRQMILPKQLWNLLTIGVSGYIVGRSGEKIVEKFKK